MRRYAYVGPDEIAKRNHVTARYHIRSARDVVTFLKESRCEADVDGAYTATFVILDDGLWIADRRSEHVACARVGDVRSAGELRFTVSSANIEIVEVSNQSTGYCPEPESWPAVANAFAQLAILHPSQFTQSVVFRRCNGCQSRLIVKHEHFVCDVCCAPLAAEWNF